MKIEFDNFAHRLLGDESRLSQSEQPAQAPSPHNLSTTLNTVFLWLALLAVFSMSLFNLLDREAQVQIRQLQKQLQTLQEANQLQQQVMIQHEKTLASQYSGRLKNLFEPPEDNSNLYRISLVLQEQEQDFQQVLQALKAGMQDLSNMLPGSRSWVKLYSEQLEAAERNSRGRSQALRMWALERPESE